jgi:hypothetical protein
MKRKVSIILLIAITISVILAAYAQPLTSKYSSCVHVLTETQPHSKSEFESDNITITLISPAINSEVVGIFNITLNITSDNGPLNLTLFVEDDIYPDYNQTPIGFGINWMQNVTVNSTQLPEGNLNFTLLFEENHTGSFQRETLGVNFLVNNQGLPSVKLLAPEVNSIFTGIDVITLNISVEIFANLSLTKMTPKVFMNVTVDGEITIEYNSKPISIGIENYTINGSRYENGEHQIEITVFTEEFQDSAIYADKTNVTLIFLDHVRFAVTGLTNFNKVSGQADIDIKIFTPYDNVTMSIYIDNVLIDDFVNVSLNEGLNTITLDTTPYSEGEHTFTFKAYDVYDHKWVYSLILVVDNHGTPSVEFIGPDEEIVVGLANFTVNVISTWDSVNITIYVDEEIVSDYDHVSITPGSYSFQIDTSNYTKWEHIVKIIVTTEEGESAEAESTFGFANFKIEEIASLAVLLGLAILIPLYRWRKGNPIRPVIVADLIFILVAAAIFIVLGVNSIPLIVWHLNLASIWALGSTLVFTNWALLFIPEYQEE